MKTKGVIGISDRAVAEYLHGKRGLSYLKIGSLWTVEYFNPDGVKEWEVRDNPNTVTVEAKNALLDTIFNSGSFPTAWYFEPFKNDYTPDGDETYAVPEYTPTNEYDESTRREYLPAAASSGSVTNSGAKAEMAMNASITVYGISLVGGGSAATTKNDTAGGGVLFCISPFSGGGQAVSSGGTLRVTTVVSMS